MRVLLIKTSSMGDVIHTLPALTDAARNIPHINFDWLIEESLQEIPRWHVNVKEIIPIAFRRWRKEIFSRKTYHEFQTLRQRLKQNQYDIVLDAQGLVKSAFFALFSQGKRIGLDWSSAREALASCIYQQKCKIAFKQHAVVRMRHLFSQAFQYQLPRTSPDFGLQSYAFKEANSRENYIVFLHGTAWESKQWPEKYWMELADLLAKANYKIKISGGNPDEMARAERIAHVAKNVEVLPKLNMHAIASLLANAKAAVAVDTGLGHLAAALHVPTLSLYGATNAEFTGALGKFSEHLSANFECSPCLRRTCSYKAAALVKPACFQVIQPARVYKNLIKLISDATASDLF